MQRPPTQFRPPPALPVSTNSTISTSADDAPAWMKVTAFIAGAAVVGGVILLISNRKSRSPASSNSEKPPAAATITSSKKTKAPAKKLSNLDKDREKFAQAMNDAAGDPNAMLAACEKAIEANPKLREAWLTQATIMARTGAEPEAILDFCDEAISALDQDLDAIGMKLSYMGQFGYADEALKEMEELPSSTRQLPSFLLLKGTLLTQLTSPDLKGARAVVEKALAISPDFEARLQYVELLERMEESELAYKELLHAERELPEDADDAARAELAVHKGRLLCDMRKYKESLKLLRSLANSNVTRVHEYIATCYILSGEGSLEEAMKELDLELQAEPNNFFASYWKAVVLCELGKPEDALPLLDQVLQHLTEAKLPAEELADFHFCKAFPLAQMDRTKDALDSLDECLNLNPMDEFAPVEKDSLLKTKKLTCGLRDYVLKKLESRIAKKKAEAASA